MKIHNPFYKKLICILWLILAYSFMGTFSALALKNGPNEKQLAAIYVLANNAIIENNCEEIDIQQPSREEVNHATKVLRPYLPQECVYEIVTNLNDPLPDDVVRLAVDVFKENLIKRRIYCREWKKKYIASLTPEQLEYSKHIHCEAVKKSMKKKLANFTQEELEKYKRKRHESAKKAIKKRLANFTPEQLEEYKRKRRESRKKCEAKKRAEYIAKNFRPKFNE
ncbi:MAG: hypothetical protein LBH49_01805 [Puniceicoccales bacterium]|jgi:hypothetical protein|nr:hypothetical protein [Puniceicoccales bacterium]